MVLKLLCRMASRLMANPLRGMGRGGMFLGGMFLLWPVLYGQEFAADGATGDSAKPWRQVAHEALERDAIYRLPLPSDLKRAHDVFQKLSQVEPLSEALRRDLSEELRGLHLSLILAVDSQGRELRLVCETQSPLRGLGVYVIRPSGTLPIVLQAPHGFFDTETREICIEEFERGDFFAAAWNTCHRAQVDLAHETRHVFHEFTKALVSQPGSLHVVQLHGFGTQKRQSAAARQADVIVSNGTRIPTRWTRHLAEELRQSWSQRDVRLFPWSIQELGATTNVQAACIANYREDSFTSLELSASLRAEWRKNQAHSPVFSQALAAVFRKPREMKNFNDQVEFAE